MSHHHWHFSSSSAISLRHIDFPSFSSRGVLSSSLSFSSFHFRHYDISIDYWSFLRCRPSFLFSITLMRLSFSRLHFRLSFSFSFSSSETFNIFSWLFLILISSFFHYFLLSKYFLHWLFHFDIFAEAIISEIFFPSHFHFITSSFRCAACCGFIIDAPCFSFHFFFFFFSFCISRAHFDAPFSDVIFWLREIFLHVADYSTTCASITVCRLFFDAGWSRDFPCTDFLLSMIIYYREDTSISSFRWAHGFFFHHFTTFLRNRPADMMKDTTFFEYFRNIITWDFRKMMLTPDVTTIISM